MISLLRAPFMIALLSLQMTSATAAGAITCGTLFRASNKVTVTFVPQPKRIENPILSDGQLDRIYDGVQTAQQAGAAILKYMKSLPQEMPSETKARVWMELTRGILRRKSLVFFSDTYRLPGRRYLFRGVKANRSL